MTLMKQIERLRTLSRNGRLSAEQQAAVLTVAFGTGPVTVQNAEQQVAVLKFLFGG